MNNQSDRSPQVPSEWASWSAGRKLRWLGPGGTALLACSFFLLPAVDILLRLSGYRRTRALLSKVSLPDRDGTRRLVAGGAAGVAATTARIGLIVGIAGRHGLWPTSCLRQALVCWLLLSRRAIPSEIRIGVGLDRVNGFAAHAWVESAGAIVLGGEHARERYSVLL